MNKTDRFSIEDYLEQGRRSHGKVEVVRTPQQAWQQQPFKPKAVLVSSLAEAIGTHMRTAALERELRSLKLRLDRIETQVIVPISSLAPEPYKVLTPIHAVVEPFGDEYVATFFDANIAASGTTPVDAVEALKELIVLTFEDLKRDEERLLGAEAVAQLAVLREMVVKRDGGN